MPKSRNRKKKVTEIVKRGKTPPRSAIRAGKDQMKNIIKTLQERVKANTTPYPDVEDELNDTVTI